MPEPLLLFAHGAGAPSKHPFMQGWARRLARFGPVETFDYPYMQAGGKRPDPQPHLVAAHRQALAAARPKHEPPPRPIVLAGKSMGSRIGCHVALEAPSESPIAALVCFGFPLGTGAQAQKRTPVLLALATPILFVQGTRDPLCPLADLERVRRDMRAPSTLHIVEGGDHSLAVGKRLLAETGRTQDSVDSAIEAAIAAFFSTALSRPPRAGEIR